MKSDHLSRKFLLAVFFSGVGAVALMAEKMGGSEFVALASLVLGLYGASNVAEKHVTKGKGDA